MDMKIYDIQWDSMMWHDDQCWVYISTLPTTYYLLLLLLLLGLSWMIIEFPWLSWIIVDYHWISMLILDYHGLSAQGSKFLVLRGFEPEAPWIISNYYWFPLNVNDYYWLSWTITSTTTTTTTTTTTWVTMDSHGLSLNFIHYYGLSLIMMDHHLLRVLSS